MGFGVVGFVALFFFHVKKKRNFICSFLFFCLFVCLY